VRRGRWLKPRSSNAAERRWANDGLYSVSYAQINLIASGTLQHRMEYLTPPATLLAQVYVSILEAICDGRLAPGERLTQDEVASAERRKRKR
jgi:hypothetical protein